MIKVLVLISGNGSNLQAMIDAIEKGLSAEIVAVISNEPNAYGLERAKKAGIPAHIISHRDFSSRDAFEMALCKQIDVYGPDIIALAGFMRRLSPDIVERYLGKMINIHPSLLPKYPGLRSHRKVLKAGDKQHGASVHFVTEDLDAGPLICQAVLNVEPNDTEERLKQRVQQLEHKLYPAVLVWFSEGRLKLMGDDVYFDEKPLKQPLSLPDNDSAC